MASLTESSLIFDMLNPKEPKKNDWYDRVYLCWEDTNLKKPTTNTPIKGFKCYRYNSFENANKAWDKDLTEYHNMEIRHATIPICKWVPLRYDFYVLNWKLMNKYWLGNHLIGRGDN